MRIHTRKSKLLLDKITLRDWFAGMALQGVAKFDGSDAESLQKVAEQAYQYADAMLAERNKTS